VKRGGVRSPRFLGGFSGWGLVLAVWCWGLVLEVCSPLKKVVLICLASRWGEIALRILRGATQTTRVYQKVKTDLALSNNKLYLIFFFVFGIPSACLAQFTMHERANVGAE
jgi:hypothetical protein